MSTKLFVNLPVQDLKKSMAFFNALGFKFNPQLTDDDASCMMISEHSYAMLLTKKHCQTFMTKPAADMYRSAEVLIALGVEDRAAVDDIVAKALAAGATEPKAKQDHGFIVQRTFEDLDGHTWEVLWMDPAHVQQM